MDKWFQSRTAIQLLSLFLAVILWFVVNSANQPATEAPTSSTTRIEVNPTVYYDEERFELTRGPGNVIVSVQGRSTVLTQIWMAQRYEVYIDLSGLEAGTHSVPVLTKGFPKGVTVDVLPDEVTIALEDVQRKEVTVVPQLIGEPAEGYKAGEPVIKPTKVLVKASDDKLEQIGSVKASVNVTGLEKDFKGDVAIRVFDTNGNEMEVEVSPAVVEVQVPITSPFIKVPLKIDFSKELPEGISIASITQNFNEVTVYGPKNVVEGLEFHQGPTIDLSTINEDNMFELRIPLGEGMTKVEPETVEVRIDVEESEELTLSDIPIKVVNTTGDGELEWVTPENGRLELTFIGAPSVLEDLSIEDVQASIDVSALPAGEHEIQVQLGLPNYIEVKEPQPKVKIRLVGSETQQSGTDSPVIPEESSPTGEE